MSEPICMAPSAIRWPPNHSTATLEMLMTSMTVGPINAIRRPVPRPTSRMSLLAAAKRFAS